MNLIGEKICILRQKEGLSQEELGEAIGVSRQTISKWETGKAVPDTKNIFVLSQLFHVDISYFLIDEVCATYTDDKAEVFSETEKDNLISVSSKLLKRIKTLLVSLSIIAFVLMVVSICIGIIAFSVQEEGRVETIYFSDLNLSILDIFLINVIFSGIIIIGIIVTCIVMVIHKKRKKFNKGE